VAAVDTNARRKNALRFKALMTALNIFVAVIVLLATVTDVRRRRIPNVLTFSAALAALVFHAVAGGWLGVAWSLAGWLAGALLFFPMFALRGMGAGDVKLLAAVGACLGPAQILIVALVASIAGGVIAVIVATTHGYLRTAVSNVWMLLTHWRVVGVEPLNTVTLEGTTGPRLAYAVPIAIGTMVTLWLR
jgi:prepilin peptidase CpaA